jgi:hypothetical protein
VLGAHTLNVDAYLELNSACSGVISYEWYVYEYFDFRKWPDNYFEIPFVAWKVPTSWADMLVDSGNAAEYWTVIQYKEMEPYSPD